MGIIITERHPAVVTDTNTTELNVCYPWFQVMVRVLRAQLLCLFQRSLPEQAEVKRAGDMS